LNIASTTTIQKKLNILYTSQGLKTSLGFFVFAILFHLTALYILNYRIQGRNFGNTYPILEFASSGRLAAAKGFLDFQNQNLEQRFYFNYPSLVNSLRNRLKGQVLGIDFDDFTKNCNTPGDLLIQSISNDGRNLSDCIGQVSGHSNVSPSKDAIEHNYLRRFHSKKGIKLPAWFDKAVQDRLESRIAQEPKIEALFQQNFGDWRDCLSTPDDFKRQLQKPNFWRRFFI
jgi:hypothetical protein